MATFAFALNIQPPAGGLIINPTFTGNPPQNIQDGVLAAIATLQATFTNPITLNITFNWMSLQAGVTGNSSPASGIPLTYAQLKTALAGNAKSADDATAVANMSTNDPSGSNVYVVNCIAKALGLIPKRQAGKDADVNFNKDMTWDTDPSNGITGGSADLQGVMIHEITHAMGRYAVLNVSPGYVSVQDFFRYTGAGVHNFVDGHAAYFSIDNGVTNLANWSTVSDVADWDLADPTDAMAYSHSLGVVYVFTELDKRLMDILGYDRA